MGKDTDKIHIFHHVYLTQHGLSIALQQLHLMSTSGLLDQATSLSVSVVYDDVNLKNYFVKVLNTYNIHTTIYEKQGMGCDERETGIRIKQFADASKGDEKILYLHTKGASRHDTKHETAINYWRQYLEYFNILNWQDCVEALDRGYDSCGVLWIHGDWKTIKKSGSHYSGSFYWIKSQLIKRIPIEHFSTNSQYGRYAMEALPSIVDHKALCLHKLDSSIVNPYHDVIQPKTYIDDNNRKKIQTEIITAIPLSANSVKQYPHQLKPTVTIPPQPKIDPLLTLREYTNNSVNKKVIYTCITNGYDVLTDPLVVNDEWDYICFSNQEIKSKVWKIIRIPNDASEEVGQMVQRKIKILPHKYLNGYDVSIWIDGNIQPKVDAELIYQTHGIKPFNISAHPFRDCIYTEFDAVSAQKKETVGKLNSLRQKYLREGYPKNNGLVQSGIILRQHNNDSIIAISNNWWKFMKESTHRDQLVFNYLMWKFPNLSKHVHLFGANILKNEFNYYHHGTKNLVDLPKNYGGMKNTINNSYFYNGFNNNTRGKR